MIAENIYLAEKIKSLLYEMGALETNLNHRDMIAGFRNEGDDDVEFDMATSELYDQYHSYANDVFKLILSYVEERCQPLYLAEIKTRLEPMLTFDKIHDEEFYSWRGESRNLFLQETLAFLNAYEVFGQGSLEHLMQRTGITYLENILINTAVIINHRKILVSNESDVYKAVEYVCRAVFPKSAKPQHAFVKTAGEYKPDILIHSLNCAVEYKFVTDEAKLKSTVEGILGDVQNYSNHPDYKLFYAVFYVKPDIVGIKRFEEIWKENNFPLNWKGIYVVG